MSSPRRLSGDPSTKTVPVRALMWYRCPSAEVSKHPAFDCHQKNHWQPAVPRFLGLFSRTSARRSVRMLGVSVRVLMRSWAQTAMVFWQRTISSFSSALSLESGHSSPKMMPFSTST
eukprot:7967372-Pyramimonas_sp.AAC.1